MQKSKCKTTQNSFLNSAFCILHYLDHLYGSIRCSLGSSPSATCLVPRLWRLVFVVLLVRMWRLKALARTILPVPVFLKRLAAPRCVFSFGISLLFCLGSGGRVWLRFRRALASSSLGQDDVHLIAFLTWHRLSQGDVRQLGHQFLENAPADLRVRHLAATEEDGGLDLVPFAQEPLDVLLLELVVVHIDLRPELDLLDLDHPLVLLGFAGALLLLILILAKVHDAAHRWYRGRRDLDQVESLLTRNDQRLWRRHDPQLLPGLVDDPDFANTDAFIGA